MNKEIDEIDKKLVNLLLFDADITNRELALKCKIALGTVNNRINRLKKEGVIKKKTVVVDYEKLGYVIEVLIALKIKKGGFYEIAKKLSGDQNVFLVMDITGDYDAELLCRFHNKRQLDEFVKKLQQDQLVEYTRTRLILNIYREKEIK
ncbi:MAG: Lrp/AsnC family transcriptional regulator [Nanoarchaeota archaeon]|nr:Lrp/AsnC family transcriptional regulator [Nanoarchaeota archaeon]MBU1004998.1 Lrp/AsnC family transcriptional regulator [Nanoarchaeota archaeon]MBU1945890.1 Lrp/AsnC family transcriptional regulator [Nanoarchaeota archaeon]